MNIEMDHRKDSGCLGSGCKFYKRNSNCLLYSNITVVNIPP